MAQWPTSVSTDAQLYIAVNALQTTLSGNIDNVTTTITLNSTTGFPTAGAVTIDSEVIFYTNISGAQLTGCVRGSDGTTAATHSSGVNVGATIVAFHHNGLKNEIIAIETDLNARFGFGSTAIAIPSGVSTAIASSGGLQLTMTSSHIKLSTASNLAIITASAQATANRTFTLPDISGNGTFAFLEGTQTFSGAKTFSSLVLVTASGSSVGASAASVGSHDFNINNNQNNVTFCSLYNQNAGTGAVARYYLFNGTQDSFLDLYGTGNTATLGGISLTGSMTLTGPSSTGSMFLNARNGSMYLMTNSTRAIQITSSQAVKVRGTSTNDNATAGDTGEYVSSTINAFTNLPATGTFGDLTSISLTAGDWIVVGSVEFFANGATVTNCTMGVSSTSGNNGPAVGQRAQIVPPTSTSDSTGTTPPIRFSLASTTTIYLKYSGSFTVATAQAVGTIAAVRIR